MVFNAGIRVAGARCCKIGGETPFELLGCRYSAEHLIKIVPAHQQRLVAVNPAKPLRQPEVNILCPWLVPNGLQGTKIERYGMVFQRGLAGAFEQNRAVLHFT